MLSQKCMLDLMSPALMVKDTVKTFFTLNMYSAVQWDYVG